MSGPSLARQVAAGQTAVIRFLGIAAQLDQPSIDALVAAGIPHYDARDLTARLERAGELTPDGWCSEARSAYLQLLKPLPDKRLDRIPQGDRPREKALALGIERLADAELLALLLRTGSGGEGVLELAERLLYEHDGLLGLAGRDVAELATSNGIGPAKAAELAAAFELGRRLAQARRRERPPMRTPEEVVAHLREHLSPLPHEEFWCLPLDARSRLIGEPRIVSKGDIDGTEAAPRPFFRLALRAGAANAIAVHNHPTGSPDPSRSDQAVTVALVAAGRAVGVPLVDHLVIGDGGRYCSLRREFPELFS